MNSNKHELAFQQGDRGDRLRPGKFDSRYRVLVSLRDAIIRDLKLLEPLSGKKVLDYGCGNKPYRLLFVEKGAEYVGADLRGNPEADVILENIQGVPLAKESFDCLLSTQVLEHVREPAIYLNEANRLLKEGGKLIISTHGIWPYHPDPLDIQRWTFERLEYVIRKAGFEIENIQSVLSLKSVALQLWQDATVHKIPFFLRKLYVWGIQCLIGLIEYFKKGQFDKNAAVYLVLARKLKAGKNRIHE